MTREPPPVGFIVQGASATSTAHWFGVVINPAGHIAWYSCYGGEAYFVCRKAPDQIMWWEPCAPIPDILIAKAMEIALSAPLTITRDMLELPVTKDK